MGKKKGVVETKKRQKRQLPAQPMIPRTKRVANFDSPISQLSQTQRCELIAEISEAILEDPQTAFSSNKIKGDENQGNENTNYTSYLQSHSKMRRLLDMATPAKNDYDETTARLAMLSLLAIFQDIIPTYRIRLPTAEELAVRVTKETKKLWDYERGLLASYQQYLKLLEYLWSSGSKTTNANNKQGGQPISAISVTALLCLCELMKSAYHFNFRSNILTIVVKETNNRSCEEVSSACCNAVTYIFENDKQGEVSLEATRMLSKMIKEKFEKGLGRATIKTAIIKTFLSLPLRVHEDEAQAAKLAAEAKNKRKKKDREQNEIDMEMREGDATVDKIVLARSQADTLHSITLTYFRILKSVDLLTTNPENSKQKKQCAGAVELLAPALEGLAKFSHLINFDTVVDVLGVLKGLLKNVEILPLDAALNCMLAALQTLNGPGRELQIDQKEYISPLYSQLPRLVTEGNDSHNTDLALKCLHAAFIRRKEYSNTRVAAFVKQLCSVSLHAPTFTSTPILAFVRMVLHRYPSAAQLLENEQDVVTSGTYTPDVQDPEHTNPFATSAWEIGTLKFHVNPGVASQALGAGANKMLMLPIEDPSRI
eukprot:CAMPEP_0203683460 /NCGR_PEP_ID=MMETSP0090-20130426/47534_1 /ASSEMBLY_ACC=CAM_ASM_001088 /TAXON_ID=426623 /ORGANISM="Chaetoceros affinis, Strain CCMP159" /LENGTH=597 /DNA_ID=CAMNT_0050552607 /DNA_START=2104 /DNA_END=3894 /DNA_ORIENTATION=-